MSTPETPQVSGLVEQLKARLDADERIALDAGATAPHWGEGGNPYLYAAETLDARSDWCLAKFGVGNPVFGDPMAQVTHAARHNPARILAMVAAHREILELHVAIRLPRDLNGLPRFCRLCSADRPYEYFGADWPCRTLTALAKGYGIQP
jgi:hypothetical protein